MIQNLIEHVDYATQILVNNIFKAEIELFENISPVESKTMTLPVDGKFIEGNLLAQGLCNIYTAAGFTITITSL